MYCNKALVGAFGVLLSELTPDKLNEGLTRVMKRVEADAETDSEAAHLARVGFPMASILVHGMREIVTILSSERDMKEVVSLVKQLFERGKITNLAVIIRSEWKLHL